ncbi:MFS transporter [Desulfuribacillus stibiiarsenatis]|uniref:MFS transporter n=1 Tax=Desulfuribacillus stibiiarsenatis TaxID=1390249 RepID=A0A1E5L5I8_9FIRM|nr:OFA family MFS transporter [Desulfuribacillus stibiiarsenatis]OEH85328.1 MFS transporter [Desulfuribacillus stibiiarsenatis]
MTKIRNRWSVVFGAVLIQLCLGAVYAWSLFNKPLVEAFGWNREDVVLTFSITIATFAFFTIIAGKLQDRIGPRLVAMGGGILLGVGLLLASTATSIYQLYFYYGVVGGAGIGAAYVCPLATCVKWFPDKRGLITGVAVAGFGAGGLLFKPIIVSLIENVGVMDTFLYLGIIYAIAIVIGSQFLVNPPVDFVPDGRNSTAITIKQEYTTVEMLKTHQFYMIWIIYFIGCMTGLLVISLAVDIGVTLVGLDASTAGNAIITIALLNAAGRIIWGIISDRLGRKFTITLIYLLTALVMLYMNSVQLTYFSFLINVSLVGFFFGGFLALFPSKTADYYGTRNLGMNYGIVYQAYGLAAFAGPILATYFDLLDAFMVASVLCLIAGGLLFFMNPVLDKRPATE